MLTAGDFVGRNCSVLYDFLSLNNTFSLFASVIFSLIALDSTNSITRVNGMNSITWVKGMKAANVHDMRSKCIFQIFLRCWL